ncbi:MAG: NCS2 family permease, partial [Solobacterium sp.]|nr:NCS2 family permease [Solobacterium sp.]
TFLTEGTTAILALIGVVITVWLYIKGVKGYMFIGIVATWVLGMICEVLGAYVPNPELGFYSVIPSSIIALPDLSTSTILQFDFGFIAEHFLDFVIVVLAFLFVDVFDTLGTVIGCATKANMLDERGKLPGIKEILMADAIGTTVGACLGTSTITTFVESSSGISEGGRTGLTALTTGLLFFVSIFLSPLFLTIPSFATSPALIIVGFLMMQQIKDLNWANVSESFPCFVCITMMGLAYSISDGIAYGIISYVAINVLLGKGKKISPLLYVLALLFILKYFII